MLLNPFTPSDIAKTPSDFFGRSTEIRDLKRAIKQGSVIIQGGIGIGKSSIIARLKQDLEIESNNYSLIFVGNSDIKTINDISCSLLDQLISVDEKNKQLKIKIPPFVEYNISKIKKFYDNNKYTESLITLMTDEKFADLFKANRKIIIYIDEADKCPDVICKFIRFLLTSVQQRSFTFVRFVVAGVNPFYKKMSIVDSGITRFFNKAIIVKSMDYDDAENLLVTKFDLCISNAKKSGITLKYDIETIERVLQLSASHPHLLQLLGSHLIENENKLPDGIIDIRDLSTSLKTICYEDREYVYSSLFSLMKIHNQFENFRRIINLSSKEFPVIINANLLSKDISKEDTHWFTDNNILVINSNGDYILEDQFLKIRMVFDEIELEQEQTMIEEEILERGEISAIYNEIEDSSYEDPYWSN